MRDKNNQVAEQIMGNRGSNRLKERWPKILRENEDPTDPALKTVAETIT